MRVVRAYGGVNVDETYDSGWMNVLATSGIIFNVRQVSADEQVVEAMVSNCEDWADTGNSQHLRLELTQRTSAPCEEVIDFIKDNLGGAWEMQLRPAAYDIDYAQKLSGFINSKRAHSLLLFLRRDLEAKYPPPDDRQSPGVQLMTQYPLRNLLKNEGFNVHTVFERLVGGDHKGRKWVKHLRAAGLTEYQIASYGQELLLQAGRLYNPRKLYFMKRSIREAVRFLGTPGAKERVIAEYQRQKWNIAVAEGVEEFVSLRKQNHYKRNLGSLASRIDRRAMISAAVIQWTRERRASRTLQPEATAPPAYEAPPSYDEALLMAPPQPLRRRRLPPPPYEERGSARPFSYPPPRLTCTHGGRCENEANPFEFNASQLSVALLA